MKPLAGICVLGALLAAPLPASAQSGQSTSSTSSSSDQVRAATTTTSGDTGLWSVPTGEVLPNRKWSVSFARTNIDDGQGFSDISTFPATFAVGVGGHVEVFGSWILNTRIDRDARPLFFTSTSQEASTGTGGGILVNYPLDRAEWTGNHAGDLWLGGKINFASQGDQRPLAAAARVMVKLPVTGKTVGVSSGKADVEVDGILSTRNDAVELSGFGGVIVRGNPSGYTLTNGFRWGVGAAFPQRYSLGFKFTTELFGENYFKKTITAPAGQTGEDGSPVPVSTSLKNPVVVRLGLTWQAPNGFFVGAATSWNVHMSPRSDATPSFCGAEACPDFSNYPHDDKGFEVRIGFHPGVHKYAPPPPPPPAPSGPVGPPTPPPAPANRPPTVRASCDPCTVEVGKTSTVTADAQDPDGDPLTYQWTAPLGSFTSATSRQTPWTAPMQEGPVRVTVAVNDGKGGTASDSVTIQVVRPAVKTYTFEDVHFEFDRYTLRPDALRVLDEVVAAMQANPSLRLEIQGNTCNIGTPEYNLALGDRRATAVRDYLVSRGIDAERLHTVSYGEERPKYDNSREETRRLNRRAALVVTLQEAGGGVWP
jgi:outer membrane protein OmpA-like peptidoglycan-associated protein